ncbi:1-phosphofructokinase [Jeotgalibaca sp. MA1X17-3]|uniref:1-phosphofructokinase n=1 Tax=Jeotgalibaca sp. MA1X17-3 TaxID=2908211 RepID=UPI002105A3F7|nr:1-phosphofructokinase [Jeotgalibaca sp. MA1X17-3]
MFYTCTTNPAIDLFIATKTMQPSIVNRTLKDEAQANGKGVNISFVLKMLGIENIALGFLGGFTGTYIEEELQKAGVQTDFIKVTGQTRINVFTRVEEENTEYKLVNQGPMISKKELAQLLHQIKKLNSEDTLFISGSNPKGVDDSFLLEAARISQENGFRLILDSSSKVVLECLQYRPALIKPNDEELAAWFNCEKLDQEELLQYGKKLIEMGAQRVLLSLGEEGAVYIEKDKMTFVNAAKGKVINTACSGDTLLGTFMGMLLTGHEVEGALLKASAAGSSTAFSSGLTDFTDVEELMKQIQVTQVKTEKGK